MSNLKVHGRWGVALGGCFAVWSLLVASDCHAESDRPEVVIYLANETAPDEAERQNYETIIGWLNSEPSLKTARIVADLNMDREQFNAAVGLEVSDLSIEIPTQKSSGGLVVITNQLFRSSKCLLWKPGDDRVQAAQLPIDSAHDNFILAANPLSRADMLEAALSYVAKQFDPRQHRFVLILKSHGSETKIATPRLAVRAEETNRDEILRIANSETPDEELPLWINQLGITKPELFSVLREVGSRQGMDFSLVFVEACHAARHRFSRDDLPHNVERLLLIRERANYINVLYADIVQRQDEAGAFSTALLLDLPAKFTLIDYDGQPNADSLRRSWPRMAYFFPLILWLACVGWRYTRRHQPGDPSPAATAEQG